MAQVPDRGRRHGHLLPDLRPPRLRLPCPFRLSCRRGLHHLLLGLRHQLGASHEAVPRICKHLDKGQVCSDLQPIRELYQMTNFSDRPANAKTRNMGLTDFRNHTRLAPVLESRPTEATCRQRQSSLPMSAPFLKEQIGDLRSGNTKIPEGHLVSVYRSVSPPRVLRLVSAPADAGPSALFARGPFLPLGCRGSGDNADCCSPFRAVRRPGFCCCQLGAWPSR